MATNKIFVKMSYRCVHKWLAILIHSLLMLVSQYSLSQLIISSPVLVFILISHLLVIQTQAALVKPTNYIKLVRCMQTSDLEWKARN